MNDVRWSTLTGVVLMLTPVAFNVFFALLSVTFGYPDILREPTGEVLRRFDAGGGSLVAIWYGFMLTAVLFVGLAILVHKVLGRRDAPYMAVATTFGVVGGVVQFLGLVRWPFLVPYLADVYLDPASGACIIVGMLEPAGFGPAADIVVVGYILWSIWLALTGVFILLPRSLWKWAASGLTVGDPGTRGDGLAGVSGDGPRMGEKA